MPKCGQPITRFASRQPQWQTIEVCPRRPSSKNITSHRIERRDYSDEGCWDTEPAAVDSGLLRRASVEPREHLSMYVALRVSTLQVVNPAPLYRDWWSRFSGVPTIWKTPFTRSTSRDLPTEVDRTVKTEPLRDDSVSRRLSPTERVPTVPRSRYPTGPLRSVAALVLCVMARPAAHRTGPPG
jgi:hypothetical protein